MTTPAESARNFATKIRKAVDFDGTIHIGELKGKYIEYVDDQCRLHIRKVVKTGPSIVKVVDGAKRKHNIKHEVIVWAYPRRGSTKKLQVKP